MFPAPKPLHAQTPPPISLLVNSLAQISSSRQPSRTSPGPFPSPFNGLRYLTLSTARLGHPSSFLCFGFSSHLMGMAEYLACGLLMYTGLSKAHSRQGSGIQSLPPCMWQAEKEPALQEGRGPTHKNKRTAESVHTSPTATHLENHRVWVPPWGFHPTADSSATVRAATNSCLPTSHLFGPVSLRHHLLGLLRAPCIRQSSQQSLSSVPPTDTCTLVLQHPCEGQPGWVSPRLMRPRVPEQFADLIM